MNIGLVCPTSLVPPGGIKNHIFSLAREFRKTGHKVIIFAPRSRIDEVYRSDIKLVGAAYPIHALGAVGTISVTFTPFGGWDLKKYRFDVIHFHQPFSPFLPIQLLTVSPGPNVATFHFYLEEEKRPPLFDSVLSLVGSTVFSRLSRLIAVSEKAALPFQKHTKQHFEIIPNGVDLTRFNPNVCPVKKYKDGKLNVLFVGRLEERKGVDFLLKAWAKFKRNKHIRLIIVGEGPLREDLLTLAKKLGISNVVFTGLMDDKTLPSYYALADIFTAPAIFGESFGMVLLEAMASGKPIVAFDNPGYKGILAQQKKYCLASNRDVIDLAEKINNLIESPEKREELSEWGICEARKYSWDKIAKMVVQVYESVL